MFAEGGRPRGADSGHKGPVHDAICFLFFFVLKKILQERPEERSRNRRAYQNLNMLIRLFRDPHPGNSPQSPLLFHSQTFPFLFLRLCWHFTLLLLLSHLFLLLDLECVWKKEEVLFHDVGPLSQSVACIITHAASLTHFSVMEATPVEVYPPSFLLGFNYSYVCFVVEISQPQLSQY